MDETSLRMWPGVRKGLVSRSWRKTGPYPLRVQRKAGLSLRRSAISYVAFIADDDTVQETLPQILIGNEHLLTRAAMDELNAEPLACRSFFLLRRKSAWLDAKCLVRLIRLLGEALRPLRENYTFLFCMDGCPTHTALPVLREIRRQRLHLFYIPVSMTGFLQPLDTHVFSLYKRFLIAEHEQKALSTVDGNLSVVEIIKTMMRGIRDVIQGRSWRQAFEQVGLGKRQRLVSPKLRESLGYASDPLVPDVLPSYAQWRSIFRHGALIPFDLLLGTSNHHAIDPPPEGHHADMLQQPLPHRHAWSGRLRSSSQLSLLPEPRRSEDPIASAAAPPPLPPSTTGWPNALGPSTRPVVRPKPMARCCPNR